MLILNINFEIDNHDLNQPILIANILYIEPLAKILKYFTNGVSKNRKIYLAKKKL